MRRRTKSCAAFPRRSPTFRKSGFPGARYVLSRRIAPIDTFVEKIWDERTLENFCEGLSRINTLKVVNDPRIFVYPEWDHADDGIKALDIVMRDIGMTTEDVNEVRSLEPHP